MFFGVGITHRMHQNIDLDPWCFQELDPEEEKRKEEAYERLQEDIDEAEPEDYLDLTLDEEKLYLEKYTNLIGL